MKQGAKTRSMLIIAGLLEEENTSRRIRSWWQAKEALDLRMSSWMDRMDVGVHVGIIGSFYRASEYRIFFSESGMNTRMWGMRRQWHLEYRRRVRVLQDDCKNTCWRYHVKKVFFFFLLRALRRTRARALRMYSSFKEPILLVGIFLQLFPDFFFQRDQDQEDKCYVPTGKQASPLNSSTLQGLGREWGTRKMNETTYWEKWVLQYISPRKRKFGSLRAVNVLWNHREPCFEVYGWGVSFYTQSPLNKIKWFNQVSEESLRGDEMEKRRMEEIS